MGWDFYILNRKSVCVNPQPQKNKLIAKPKIKGVDMLGFLGFFFYNLDKMYTNKKIKPYGTPQIAE